MWSSAAVAVALGLASILLAGCPNTGDGSCDLDEDCNGGEVCARDRYCAAASSVREVTVTWTIGGQPASASTCPAESFTLDFLTPRGAPLSYTPVPCRIGQFFVDKLPFAYTQAAIGGAVGTITSDGTVRLAL